MPSRLQGTTAALRSPFPWVALSAAIAITAAGWFGLERSRRDEARTQFDRRADSAIHAVHARMQAYEQVLRSGAARVSSDRAVTREEFHRFIAQLQLTERYPGLQSVGYAEHVTAAALREHIRRMRSEGFGDYDVRPPSDAPEHVVIVYNEPFVGRNARVLGYDMYSDATRRAAMDRARESGEASITGRVLLAGESFRGAQPQQPGFVMYVPVFQEPLPELPRRERRNAISGFVFSSFRTADLMRGVLDEGTLSVLDMRIFDEAEQGTQSELLDTRAAWHGDLTAADPYFVRIVHFPMPGRNWTLQFISRPEFDAAITGERPWLLLGTGMLASAVVFMLILALVEAWNRAHDLSMRDPLTGLFNRRYVDETMGRELPRARRMRQSIGLIVLDIDHFKLLNDSHGHDAGDYVLARVGDLLRAMTRSGDIPCRLGGEEFAVILPGATLDNARQRAEAIRAAFQALAFDFRGGPLDSLTLSAGVSALPPHDADWARALRVADRALYSAKQAGRNRVVAASGE
jgi:diguanylate cyclase (GGDEF)-like protein